MNLKSKKLIIFDLDGTLTESKADLSPKTGKLLSHLLQKKAVTIIGGARYAQFQKQFLGKFKAPKNELKNLFLFPTNSALFYRFSKNKWRKIYAHNLTRKEKAKILNAFERAYEENNYQNPYYFPAVLVYFFIWLCGTIYEHH